MEEIKKPIKKEEKKEFKKEIKKEKKIAIKPIKFENSGWCDELNKSYFKGVYLPKNEKEYNILSKYGA